MSKGNNISAIMGVVVGAVAGGLAGAYYGIDNIPEEWVEMIPRLDWIKELV